MGHALQYFNHFCFIDLSTLGCKKQDGKQSYHQKVVTTSDVKLTVISSHFLIFLVHKMKAMLVALLLLHQLFGALAYHTHTYAGQTASVSAAFGDGTDARGSRIFDVRKIWKNQQGSLFLVDAGHQLVRMVSSSGILSTIAGGGANRGNTTTFPLPALSVKFSDLYGIAGDNNGHLFLSEKSPCVIRRLTAEGSSAFADIIAGQYGRCGYNGSPDPLSANFYSPSGIYYSAGMLYVADTLNHIIQAIALDSQGNALDVRLLAGVPGSSGYIDPTDITLLRLLNRPQDVFVNGNSVYIADTYNCMVRVYTGTAPPPSIQSSRFADFACWSGDMNMLGIAIGKQDSCATSVVEGSLYSSTPLYYPDAICGDVDTGNLYVSQMYNGYKVRVVDKVYTVTGSSGSSIRRTGPYARTTRVGDSFGCLVDKNVLHFADPVNGYVFQTPYPSKPALLAPFPASPADRSCCRHQHHLCRGIHARSIHSLRKHQLY